MQDSAESELRTEIGYLGKILGDTIRDFAGEQGFEMVEELRKLAWDRRTGVDSAEQVMTDRIASLESAEILVVIHAFAIFLDLLNMAEDRQRVRILSQRAREAYPQPRNESIRDAIADLKESGKSAAEIQSILDSLHIELVFTAHPTDAKRRSIRRKLIQVRELLTQLDGNPLPEQRQRIEQMLRGEIAKIWQTDFIRPWRPTVMQEVARGLSIKPVLWNEVPRIANELRCATDENYKNVTPHRPCLTFGTWIGGDRDGHPGVTADVTKETVAWLRHEAIRLHLHTCDELFDSLSLSTRQTQIPEFLVRNVLKMRSQFPILDERLSPLPPGEVCRHWLSIIRWRLESTQRITFEKNSGAPESIAGDLESPYASASELMADVDVLATALERSRGGQHSLQELQAWRAQIETFGFHLARLDVRQNAKVYYQVIDEVLRATGRCENYESATEAERIKALTDSLGKGIQPSDDASDMAKETFRTFEALNEITDRFSAAAFGAHVISMTAAPSDILAVLWFASQVSSQSSLTGSAQQDEPGFTMPIAPLLETIDDLQAGPAILEGMLKIPVYRDYLRSQGDRQMIMLGYSDSTKDGGYISACWSLYHAQQQLIKVADKHGIELTFFHGRGGSLGRGGGPTARSILSLPHGTFRGSLRLTEQGEVLSDRYDDPAIAHRHLEQVVWSSLLAVGNPADPPPSDWIETMNEASHSSFRHYRQLLEQPGFVDFFRQVTPIAEIEQLPIGSRPSRRKPGGGLSDLRAIPWVFSWTQSRCLLPAWYGMGSAFASMIADPAKLQQLHEMYQRWPFFRAMIDNAELALAKSDIKIAEHYAKLAGTNDSRSPIGQMIEAEFDESRRAVLQLTGRDELLGGTPWLKESIRVRNRFIDPLNLIQVELLRRSRRPDQRPMDAEELRHLTRLSINGIASGMRTSG